MQQQVPYVITISRQLGSAGACIGKKVAAALHIHYADRDILERAARALNAAVVDLEPREETSPSFLQAALEAYSFGGPDAVCVPALELPSYTEVRETQAQIIRETAAAHSAVIVGRAGFHVLRAHPRHLSVFLHADLAFRVRRTQEQFGLSSERALKVIEETESARDRYLEQLTGRPRTDALQYDLSLCTSSIGIDTAVTLVCELAAARFGLA